jgi:hypothetical protein
METKKQVPELREGVRTRRCGVRESIFRAGHRLLKNIAGPLFDWQSVDWFGQRGTCPKTG